MVSKVYKEIILEGVFKTSLFVFTSRDTHEEFRNLVSSSAFFSTHLNDVRKVSFRWVILEVNPMTDTNLVRRLEGRLSVALNWQKRTVLCLEFVDFAAHPDMADLLDPDSGKNTALLSKISEALEDYQGRFRTDKFVVSGLTDCPVGNALAVMFNQVAGSSKADLLGSAKYMELIRQQGG